MSARDTGGRRHGRRVARLVAALTGAVLAAGPTAGAAGAAAGGAGERGEAPAPRTLVSLTFDDGFASQLLAADVLAERGLVGTFYLSSALLGTRPYVDVDAVASLVAQGHEVGGHTLRHEDLLVQEPAVRAEAICADRSALRALGAPAVSFAYPFGSFDDAVAAQVRRCGYSSARGVSGLSTGDGTCEACPATESWRPVDHRFGVRTPSTVRADDSLADLVALVERAERTGGWLPLVVHRICEGCAEESTSVATFTAFADWLTGRPASTVVVPVAAVTDPTADLAPGPAPGPAPAVGLPDAAAPAAAGPTPTSTPSDPVSDGPAGDPGGRGDSGGFLPPPREEATLHVGGLRVDQLTLLGVGLLTAVLALVVHRVATRSRRYR